MKKRILSLILMVLILLPLVAVTASADCGPKPSTVITVHTGGGERCVVTLLAEKERWGISDTVEPDETPADWMVKNKIQEEAWYAFRDYRDPDGFHFWGNVFEGNVAWGYMPPEVFKIAVYYPDYDILWVSEDRYERYAFHSDFRLNLPALGTGAQSGEVDMVVKKSSDLAAELAGFLIRVVLTLAVELALARLFGFDEKRQQKVILRVNLITQVGLNLLLWVWYFFDGPIMAILRLAAAELVVLIAESVAYLRLLRSDGSRARILGYTILANLASVTLGFLFLS